MQFSHILPADFLHGLSVSKRIRQYCNIVVFWAWLAQILEANASLSKAVSLIQAWCDDLGLPVPGKDTSAHDAPIFHKLLHCFNPGDILCGDRAFCTYELISTLHEREVHTLMRLHQARHRKLDWRRGKRMDAHQRLFIWKKPAQQPSGSTLDAAGWDALPDEMEVRLIRFYFEDRDGKKRRMVLATTLTEHEKYDWQELAALYAQRWDIELRLRDVKTTLGLEHLRVKTPENARKTLKMALIAYNLIKSSCQEAAHSVGEDLRMMSFKGALDTIVANTARYLRRQKHVKIIREIWESTIAMIAEKVIHFRPFRYEPRAQKKRPKSYSYLTKPRAEYKETPHRGKSRTLA